MATARSISEARGPFVNSRLIDVGASKGVKVGKFFDVTIEEGDKPVAETVKEISEGLLVNFNMETYSYKILEEK